MANMLIPVACGPACHHRAHFCLRCNVKLSSQWPSRRGSRSRHALGRRVRAQAMHQPVTPQRQEPGRHPCLFRQMGLLALQLLVGVAFLAWHVRPACAMPRCHDRQQSAQPATCCQTTMPRRRAQRHATGPQTRAASFAAASAALRRAAGTASIIQVLQYKLQEVIITFCLVHHTHVHHDS